MNAARSEPEVHAFLLWSNALPRVDHILADIASHFTILDVASVEWRREHFASNLTRFYGQILPSGSEKEVHCGIDPFLVVTVADARPAYGLRRTTRGKQFLNTRTFDAKTRYRRWTGGGHRVHATVNRREADKDLFLLLGQRTEAYKREPRHEWDRTITTEQRDLLGASGWRSRSELLTALQVVTGYVALRDPGISAAEETPLELLVGDLWWAARI